MRTARDAKAVKRAAGAPPETAPLANKIRPDSGVENAASLANRLKIGSAIEAAARQPTNSGAFQTRNRLVRQAAEATGRIDPDAFKSSIGLSIDPGKLEAIQAAIAPNTRTYPEIALDAQRLADRARARAAEPVRLPKRPAMPSGEEVALRALMNETRKQSDLMADIGESIKLGSQTAERQEAGIALVVASLGAVVEELKETRTQEKKDGATIAFLTKSLVAFTIGLFLLTAVIAWLTWSLVNAGG